MKASSASERWLRERNAQGGDAWDDVLRDRYAPEIARLDSAERRLLACSETAQEHARTVVVSTLAWHHEPERMEALAAVAEDFDRRHRVVPCDCFNYGESKLHWAGCPNEGLR